MGEVGVAVAILFLIIFGFYCIAVTEMNKRR
jgi:hypothetical protein